MGTLLKQNFRHVLRTRVLLFALALSFFVQWAGLQSLKNFTLHLEGDLGSFFLGRSNFGEREGIFLALFLHLFTGTFLSAVYGIWVVPYLHQGDRSQLTFTLPISKWKFPLGYGVTMLGLLFLLHLVMFATFGFVFGFRAFMSLAVPWKVIAVCLVVETLAFMTLMFAFACSAMAFGQIPTFFIGVFSFFSLQLAAVLFRLNLEKLVEFESGFLEWSRFIYNKLPPMGELVFDLGTQFSNPTWNDKNIWLWLVWLSVFASIFRLTLRYPRLTRRSEG